MDPTLLHNLIGLGGLVTLVVMIFLHVPIAVAMAMVGFATSVLLTGNLEGGLAIFADSTTETLSYAGFAVIPLFVLMGGFAGISGLSADLYRIASRWLGWMKGGVGVATVGTCAGFGAICGSSVATTAAMVNMALPEMEKRRYSPSLIAGTIIGGSTLGSIIPPSMIMVIYAIQAEVSIKGMFVASLFPGLIAMIFAMLAVRFYLWRNPTAAPGAEHHTWKARIISLLQGWLVLLIAFLMTGGLYLGVVTVDEAAAAGALLTLLAAVFRRRLTLKSLRSTLVETAGSVGMVYMILIGAKIFSNAVTESGVTQTFVNWVLGLGFSPLVIIFLLVLAYLAMGTIFDAMAAMVLTLPFVIPIITDFGYDLLWWGIVNVMIIEVGMITPPVGINIFVFQGMVPRIELTKIYAGLYPFVTAGILRIVLVVLVPSLTLVLLK